MDISELKVPSVRRSYNLTEGQAPEPEICGLPVRVAVNDAPSGEADDEEFEEPDTLDEEAISEGLDLMETAMKTLDTILDDGLVVMPEDLKKRVLHLRLDLYAFIRQWTDIDEREAQAKFAADKAVLAQELAPLFMGMGPVYIDKTIMPTEGRGELVHSHQDPRE